MKILFLEDNSSDADLARRELARSDPKSTIDIAPTLAEARLRLAGGAGYDVVLADLRLPDGNGLDLLHEIRGQGLPVAVVILTGAGDEATAVAALKAGADDYIAKRGGYVSRLPTTLEAALGRFRAEVARRAGTLRVLYAEHHAADIALTRHHLETRAPHIRLEVVNDGKTVLARLPGGADQACPWDVLLLDYRLPGDSALDVLKVVREDRHLDVPVVLVTGQGDEEVATQALRLGATDYLVKNPNYLYALPAALENAHHRVLLAREQAALRDSRARLASVVDSAMDAIISIDAEQRILLFNPAAEMLFGRSRDDAIGQHLERLMPERFRVNHRTHVQEFAGTGTTTRAMGRLGTLYGLRADGSEFPIEASISRAQVAGKSIYTVILRDVTERTESIERLRESEERFRATFEQAAVGIAHVAPDGRWLRVNNKLCDIVGYSAVELQQRTFQDLTHSDDLASDLAQVHQVLSGKIATYSMEKRYFHKSGAVVWINLTVSLVRRGDGSPDYFVSVIEDATERKRAEEERGRLESQLRQSQKMEAIGRLAGGVAHDFNNMLGVILGYADMALRKLRPIDPIYKHLHEIRDAGQRSAELTRQLLAFSRQQPIAPQVLDLNAQLRGMERLLQRIIGEDVALEFALAPDLWPVLMDRSQVDQAIANLAVNSRDAMPDGGKLTVETANITADATYCKRRPGSRPGDYVVLAVSDTGTGMDEATRERAFEPFFTTKAEGKGTGLGLASIYGIVRQNDGFVDIYSEPGQGTTIRLHLPRSREQGETSDQAAATDRPAARGHETVLVVEDQDQLREVARELLAELGYTVLEAASPGEALALCQSHPGDIHLLLTDVVMPTMNGKDLAARIQALKPSIRTLFTSGYTSDTISRRGVLEPGVHFLEKPFSFDSLARKVRQVLSG